MFAPSSIGPSFVNFIDYSRPKLLKAKIEQFMKERFSKEICFDKIQFEKFAHLTKQLIAYDVNKERRAIWHRMRVLALKKFFLFSQIYAGQLTDAHYLTLSMRYLHFLEQKGATGEMFRQYVQGVTLASWNTEVKGHLARPDDCKRYYTKVTTLHIPRLVLDVSTNKSCPFSGYMGPEISESKFTESLKDIQRLFCQIHTLDITNLRIVFHHKNGVKFILSGEVEARAVEAKMQKMTTKEKEQSLEQCQIGAIAAALECLSKILPQDMTLKLKKISFPLNSIEVCKAMYKLATKMRGLHISPQSFVFCFRGPEVHAPLPSASFPVEKAISHFNNYVKVAYLSEAHRELLQRLLASPCPLEKNPVENYQLYREAIHILENMEDGLIQELSQLFSVLEKKLPVPICLNLDWDQRGSYFLTLGTR